jgi:putative sigma-54 modulation protein
MNVTITARHFKAHETLREYALGSMKKLEKYYDNIVTAEVILGYEKSANSLKSAEVLVSVHGALLKAIDKSEDFPKSIDAAVAKVERQLVKYKAKQREKKKTTIREKQAKV